MKIEIWSDFTCPFCYLGKKQFELAFEQFPYKDAIIVEFISSPFQIDVMEKKELTAYDVLMERHSLSPDEFTITLDVIEQMAKELDLCISVANTEHMNTYDAHRLLKLAKKEEKELVFMEAVFQSYFAKGLRIDNKDVLHEIALASGLEEQAIEETLSLNCFGKSVEADRMLAADIGVNQLPFFIFEEKYAVAGVESADVLLQVMFDVWKEEGMDAKCVDKAKRQEKKYCTGVECER